MDEVIVPALLDEADESYLAARLLAFGGSAIMQKSAYLAHLAIELYLKTIITSKKTLNLQELKAMKHDLPSLLHEVETLSNLTMDSSIREAIIEFDKYDQIGRYGANATFDPDKKNSANFMARGIFIADDFVNKLDRIASNLRKQVDDGIKREGVKLFENIKNKNPKHSINRDWNLNITPDDILKIGNKFYTELK